MAEDMVVISRTITMRVEVPKSTYPNMNEDEIRRWEETKSIEDAVEEIELAAVDVALSSHVHFRKGQS